MALVAAGPVPGTRLWPVAVLAVLLPASSAVPSPMYELYQDRWSMTPAGVTAVFGAHCLVSLAATWLFGSLSDVVGRRPVLVAAAAFGALSMALFLTASNPLWLLLARCAQGFGCGLGASALAAALVDLARPPLGATLASLTPIAGIGVGALGTGVLVEYGPAPSVLPYVATLVLLVLSALSLLRGRERGRAALVGFAPQSIGVPKPVRRAFLVLAVPVAAVWAVGGLYLSLGPSLAAEVLGGDSPALTGLAVAVLAGAGAVAHGLCARWRARVAVPFGCVALLAGLAAVALSLSLSSPVVFVAGTAVLGLGWGATYLASFRLLAALADPLRRGELFAAANVVAALATAFPSMAAGLAVPEYGLHAVTVVFFAAVAVLVLGASLVIPRLNAMG